MTDRSDWETLIAEASYLLSLTHNFSSSFAIKRERVRNWRLMGFVMELEVDGVILPDPLCDKIETLIPRNKSKRSLQNWLDKCVEQFGNDAGQFWPRIRSSDLGLPVKRKEPVPASEPGQSTIRHRSENIRQFRLNANFDECAKNYVSGLKSVHQQDFSILRETNISDDVARRVMKEIFKFQTAAYWPLFGELLEDLVAVARKNRYAATGIDEDNFKILHFVLLLMFWRLKPA